MGLFLKPEELQLLVRRLLMHKVLPRLPLLRWKTGGQHPRDGTGAVATTIYEFSKLSFRLTSYYVCECAFWF